VEHGVAVALACVVGLLCGSFTNVLIARIPVGKDWVRGSSQCPKCEHPIAWYDNIPVLAWLWLRGRCRHCAQPISARYPVVELSVAALFGLVALVHGLTVMSALLAFFAIITVALSAIDFEHMRLPNPLVLALGIAVVVLLVTDAAVAGEWWPLTRALLGALILGGAYFVLWFIYPRGLGFGDVKLALPLGAVLGYLGWSVLAVGALLGPLVGALAAIAAVAKARKFTGVKMPYGPWMICAFWIGALWGVPIATWYVDLTLGLLG